MASYRSLVVAAALAAATPSGAAPAAAPPAAVTASNTTGVATNAAPATPYAFSATVRGPSSTSETAAPNATPANPALTTLLTPGATFDSIVVPGNPTIAGSRTEGLMLYGPNGRDVTFIADTGAGRDFLIAMDNGYQHYATIDPANGKITLTKTSDPDTSQAHLSAIQSRLQAQYTALSTLSPHIGNPQTPSAPDTSLVQRKEGGGILGGFKRLGDSLTQAVNGRPVSTDGFDWNVKSVSNGKKGDGIQKKLGSARKDFSDPALLRLFPDASVARPTAALVLPPPPPARATVPAKPAKPGRGKPKPSGTTPG